MPADEKYKYSGFLQTPNTFNPGVGPHTKRQFLQLCMQSKQIPAWKATMRIRLNMTPAQTAAPPYGTRVARFNALLQNLPAGFR